MNTECQAEISPAFKLAIARNLCPGCDGPILTEEAKKLMEDLAAAMEKMPADPVGIAGWLLANYTMIKVGDGAPVNFYGKPINPTPSYQQPQGNFQQNNFPNLKHANSPVQKMLKRAGAENLTGPNKYRELTAAIQSGTVDQIYGTGQPLIKDLDQDFSELDQAEQEAVMNRSNFTSQAKMIAAHSGELLGTGNETPLDRNELQYLTNKVSNMQNVDLTTSLGQQALEENRLARLAKQQKMSMGGGAFTRG